MLSLNYEKSQTLTATSKFHEQTNQNNLKKNTNANKSSPLSNGVKVDVSSSKELIMNSSNLRPKRKFSNENSYSNRSQSEEKPVSSSKKTPASTTTTTSTTTATTTTKSTATPVVVASTLNSKNVNNTNLSPLTSNATNTNGLIKKPKVLINDEYCNYCYEGGNILNCDRCPASFHFLCHEPPLNFDEIPAGEFLCNKCKSNAICKKLNENSRELNFDTNLIHFFKANNESPLKTLTRMSKSFNPKQMFFPIEFNRNLNVNIPGLNKIEWLYENHGDKQSNSKYTQPLNYELLYFLSLKSINYSPKSFTTQIAQNQYRDIHTLNQLANTGSNSNGSVYAAKTFNTAASRNENGQNWSNGCNNVNVCFICQNNVKLEKLAQCDFCLLSYHLDCLDPPLCEAPSKEKFWMCPSHVEHILDRIFPKTNRLTDRIKLWNLYTTITCNTDDTKYEFIKKIDIEKKREPIEPQISYFNKLKRCKIPPEIKKIYSKRGIRKLKEPSCHEMISNLNGKMFRSSSQTSNTSDTSSESSNESDFSNDDDDDQDEKSKTAILTSFKQIKFESGLRPKAFFLVLTESILRLKDLGYENLNIISLADNNDLLFVPFNSNKDSFTIGYSQEMDLVIDKQLLFNSKTRTKKCNHISDKHLCVNYDILTNTFELLNWSKYGTMVDNFLYGLDNETKNCKDTFKHSKCKCRKKISKSSLLPNSTVRLKHGSVLGIGCLNFLFITFDSCSYESKVMNSIVEYEELKGFNENKYRENELLKLKWKNKEKSLANKKDLLSMCSFKIKSKLKNENKRLLFD